MELGVHVRSLEGLREADAAAEQCGLQIAAYQVFIFGPQKYNRLWSDADAAAVARDPRPVVVHSNYIAGGLAYSPKATLGQQRGARKFLGALVRKSSAWSATAPQRGAATAGCVVHIPDAPPREVVRGAAEILSNAGSRGKLWLETSNRPAFEGGAAGTDYAAGHWGYGTAEQLRALLAGLDGAGLARAGICVDTAHVWAQGVDLRSYEQASEYFRGLLEASDRPRGRFLLHFNDSRSPRGSGRDEHEVVGSGEIWGEYAGDLAASGACATLEFARETGACALLERTPADLPRDFQALATLAALF